MKLRQTMRSKCCYHHKRPKLTLRGVSCNLHTIGDAPVSRYRRPLKISETFVWEIYYWDLRTLNNAKPYFFLRWYKKDLPAMYSTAFWCLFVVLLFFWLYCVTTVTPFIERSEGWSLRSVGVLDQSQQECRFSHRNSSPLQTFQLQPKRETSSSSLGDQLIALAHQLALW